LFYHCSVVSKEKKFIKLLFKGAFIPYFTLSVKIPYLLSGARASDGQGKWPSLNLEVGISWV
jgi:hypothetical protein